MGNIKFELNDAETQRVKEWVKEHQKICPRSFKNGNLPTLGDHYYYKFIPNGLGNSVEIGCLYCKDHKDVTDTNDW